MSAIVKGKGVVWSIGAITYTGAITSATSGTSHFNQALTINRNSEHKNIMDQGGTYRSSIYYGFLKTLSITVIPASTTAAGAITQLDAWTPQAGGVLTIVDPNSGSTITDGAWNIVSVRQGRTVDGVATVDIELEAGDESEDITTTVAAGL